MDLVLHDGSKEEDKKSERLVMTVYLVGVESPVFPGLHYCNNSGGMHPALGHTGKLCDANRRSVFLTFNDVLDAQSHANLLSFLAGVSEGHNGGWKYFVVPMEYEEEGKK